MIDRQQLSASLKAEVVRLVDDLRTRVDTVPEVSALVHDEWQAAADVKRTAHNEATWREDMLAQVAVSWVLGCVFIRFCEDNRLVTSPLLSGRGEWRRWAADAQIDFFRANPEAGERRYLQHVFTEASTMPGLSEVFGSHNPLWRCGPSDDACRALIERWRATAPDTGELVWDFADPTNDTRFLGDLYEHLSEHARDTYALRQTPDFVESFILDRTLEPAIEEFGLNGLDGKGFRIIDPACGSGHFLLGAFRRLAEHWLAKELAGGKRAAAARALGAVYGVDLNPFAASIARFRLLVAALRFAEVPTLAEAPNLTINIAVGDSLLHGPPPGRLQGVIETAERQSDATRHLYETEDRETIGRFLGQHYHAVVANPPYITPNDAAAAAVYRARFSACHRQYSLSVPFMQRSFDLAIRGTDRPAGFVGQITANSFMKREFGRKLVEDFLSLAVDLTHVIDTSGAYIPGHGIPTVILLGRNRPPSGATVRAVLGLRGEPGEPIDASEGRVWRSIVDLVDRPDVGNEYVSVAEMDRAILAEHPWSLQGGVARKLKERIDLQSKRLGRLVSVIGYTGQTNIDDAMRIPEQVLRRRRVEPQVVRALAVGDSVRDWAVSDDEYVIFPYDDDDVVAISSVPMMNRWLWAYRTLMGERRTFGKKSYFDEGRPWWAWHQVAFARLRTPLSIAFADVATHNHFVVERKGRLLNRTAPAIKLPAGAKAEDHLDLAGLLNSAVACFWMKQMFQCKGSTVNAQGARQTTVPFEDFFQFDGTKLKQFPVASGSVLDLATALDALSTELTYWLPTGVVERSGAAGETAVADMTESRTRVAALRNQMVWLQEELDWRCAFLYGITEIDLSFPPGQVFELEKGQRAFEIALARQIELGEAESTWFVRHQSTPIIEPPGHWPEWYRARVEQRLALIEDDRFVNLLERPEYKRRWNWAKWDDLANDALRSWLLTRLEDAVYWPTRAPRSVAQLADTGRADEGFIRVAQLYRGIGASAEVDLVALIGELAMSDAVPYLSALRYSDTGLRKRAAWEQTWDLQRAEDAASSEGAAGAGSMKIPAPPKYVGKDFRSNVMWSLRGKLDVPKERFVSYPEAERAADDTAVLGWAGWNHLQQAEALVALYLQRSQHEGWETERLVPMLAGLAELVPWLLQWHNEYDANLGQGLGDYYAAYLAGEIQRLGSRLEDLAAWRPPVGTKGQRAKGSKRSKGTQRAEGTQQAKAAPAETIDTEAVEADA